jgi:hypothetical protein
MIFNIMAFASLYFLIINKGGVHGAMQILGLRSPFTKKIGAPPVSSSQFALVRVRHCFAP